MNPFFLFFMQRKFLATLAVLLLAIVAASGGRFLTFKSDYKTFFGEDNPQLQAFEKMQKTFAKSDNVSFLVASPDGDVFTPRTLSAIEELTEKAWQIPYSSRVDSISNFQHTVAEEDDLIVDDLIIDAARLTAEQLAAAKATALSDPTLANNLVSASGHVTAVNVTIQIPDQETGQELPEIMEKVRGIQQEMLQSYPELTIHLNGLVVMNDSFAHAGMLDSQTLVPMMFGAVIVMVGLLLRTISGTIATLVVVICSIATAMGLFGWAGFYLTNTSFSAPIMILTLAVADCVHILSTMFHQMRQGENKFDALLFSLKLNFQPVFLTSVTTAIGFLSLNFSDSPPFNDLGNIVAIGVMMAFVFAITLFPAMVMILPFRVPAQREHKKDTMNKLADFVINRHRSLFTLSLVVIVTFLAFIPRNELNDNPVEYFDESLAFRQAADFSAANLTGNSNINFELQAGESGGINAPEFLAAEQTFATWLRQQPETLHVNSLTDTFTRLNKNMHGDDPAYYKLPENRELAAQYLLLYEMSLPYGLDLNNQINVDKSSTRLIATFGNLSTRQMLDFEARSQQWLAANLPELKVSISSSTLMFAHIGERNRKTMLYGTLLALVLISGILGFALRSMKYGLISLAPNLIPAGVAFGIWGLTNGNIGLGLTVVIGMTLGIVVDDTVHFLSKYLYALRKQGATTEEAIRYAFSSVGKALWVTTLVLSTGFFVLAQSTFKMNADTGLMTSLTIVIALIVDFFFLPALILKLRGRPTTAAAETKPHIKTAA